MRSYHPQAHQAWHMTVTLLARRHMLQGYRRKEGVGLSVTLASKRWRVTSSLRRASSR